MTPLVAQLRTEQGRAEQRGAPRRTLKLEVGSNRPDSGGFVLIHNISRYGLLLETRAPLELDETIEVELPEAGPTLARIVRSESGHFGCRFVSPISNGAVSAALLRSPADSPVDFHSAPLLATAAAVLREEMWSEIEHEITPIERVLLYVFLVLAAVAAALFVYALLALSISA